MESAAEKNVSLRLQKYLADHGIASRRGAETLIREGAVKVNGKTVTVLGTKIDPTKDRVEVSSVLLEKKKEELTYVMLHKPLGYVTTTHRTEAEPKIVLDLLPPDMPRLFPVGRLDKESSGFLLLTNDGELAFRLMHPRFEHEKEYLVETTQALTKEQFLRLRSGMTVLGQKTLPPRIVKLSPYRFLITLKEGKNRQIRRLLRKVGSGVSKLKRIRIGNLRLDPHLKPGKFRKLTPEEIRMI